MAISYNRLGSNGRLGNQMFQYAGLRGIAANRGFDWVIPPESHSGETNYSLFQCFEMYGVGEKNKGFGNQKKSVYEKKQFHFNETLFNQCEDDVDLETHFQSEKYFKHIENDIRKDFSFRPEVLNPCLEIINGIGDAIFLHVRRGDYVRVQNYHPLLTEDYYKKSLEKFDSNIPVIVLSDDSEWCGQQDIFKPDRFFISENTMKFDIKMQMGDGAIENSLIPFWDLCLMSLCKGGIIANSSMSWWGAWLINNKDKKIISPDPNKWFGQMYSHYVMDDLISKEWEIVQ